MQVNNCNTVETMVVLGCEHCVNNIYLIQAEIHMPQGIYNHI